MNAKEKSRFIRELSRNVTRDILLKVEAMPAEWDGHELRAYMAAKFSESAMTVGRAGPYGRQYAARTRAYHNSVLERGL